MQKKKIESVAKRVDLPGYGKTDSGARGRTHRVHCDALEIVRLSLNPWIDHRHVPFARRTGHREDLQYGIIQNIHSRPK